MFFGYEIFYKEECVSCNRGYETREEAMKYVDSDLKYFEGRKDKSGQEYQKEYLRYEIFEDENCIFEDEKESEKI